ncbi:MAG: response regulator [Planctomycetes bacterium]|jgi:two-component system chemotaxis response regulator CheY|nr:response regulator [Planctomycetota bacterium]
MTKILVVDDSATMRQQVRQVLTGGGFEVVEAVDGQDGLAKVTADKDVKVMILDVNMPRMNGIELAEALHANGRMAAGLNVVMLTTEGHAELIARAKAAGAKGWIVKPFKPDLLLAAVKKMAA